MEMKVKTEVEKLKELGFQRAAATLEATARFDRAVMIAYEHFRRVSSEQFAAFNEKLRDATFLVDENRCQHYDQLIFTDIAQYSTVPPADVLESLKEAQKFDIFDYYEIAHIQSVTIKPDPILFGCINGCPDKFFIAQWDNDVKIENILASNEG